eukprot:TRINITY_DN72966_c0_g1_i1.p1 TRINITY_DN72966_c0_g1~~TRINITY_DN72966_c0_g1_i1.p1  ORF type:complete len:264 (-),score=36.36 TRINITY_DN72966_c0_g1_i1:412-1203(-)
MVGPLERRKETLVSIPVGWAALTAQVLVQPSPVVVIATHPWGPLGGSMDDPHPVTVCRMMAEAGCSTARFNFRSGINRGPTSVADVKAVASWFTEPRDGNDALASQVLLVGYSYGSIIAAAAAAEIPQSIGYAVIGPPLAYTWALYLLNGGALLEQARNSSGKPKLALLGTEDIFCSVPAFESFVDSLPEPKTSMIKDGVDHFGMYRYLRESLDTWIRQSFACASLAAFAQSGAPAACADGSCSASSPAGAASGEGPGGDDAN